MHRFFLVLAIAFVFSLSANAQQACKEYGPVGAVLSMCPPAGTQTVKNEGELHSGFVRSDSPKAPFAMAMSESTLTEPLGEFGYEMIVAAYTDTKFSNTVLLDVGDFPSANGVRGLRLVFDMEGINKVTKKKDQIRQIYYIYGAAGDIKVTFNSIFLAADTAAMKASDEAMKTVKIKK